MVLDRILALAGDEDELLDARFARLLHGVLDEGFVDNGKHLLGYRLGRRQEPRTQPAHRQNRFPYRFH